MTDTTPDTTPYTLPDGIMAMTEDDGTVVTLLKRDPEHGATYRHDGAWVPLVDPTVLDDLAFVGVTDDAEGLYDSHESQDQLVDIGQYNPSATGPYWPNPVRIPNEATAADEEVEPDAEPDADVDDAESTAPVTLDSADDLPEAIAAAVSAPDLQWFVEHRVKSLGLDAYLPWLKD